MSTGGFTLTGGSPYRVGTVVPLAARTNISGGQFVIMSGNLAMVAPVDSLWPIGVCQATVASGGTANVIINGISPQVSEGTIAIGGCCQMGHGAAQNCVKPADATVVVSGVRLFGVLASAGSEGTVFVQF